MSRLREFRRADGERLFQFLKTEFPAEEAVLGMRAEGFRDLLARLYRPDIRFALGFLRLVRRSPFHLYVIEDGGEIVATTLLSFATRAGFVSTVVVAPEHRRRGLARQLLEKARASTARRRHPYIALSVLEENAPARALYSSIGYRTLDRRSYLVHDRPVDVVAQDVPPSIRPFARSDADALAAIAQRAASPTVQEVLPVRSRDLLSGSIADRVFSAETVGWVVDRGRGAEAHVAATSTPTTDAGHLSSPIVGDSVEPALAGALVRTAVSWLAARHPARVVVSVPDTSPRARASLEEAGFHDAFALLTLYRPSR